MLIANKTAGLNSLVVRNLSIYARNYNNET